MLHSRALRALAAVVVACALPLLVQSPACASSACPMAGMARAGCTATGTMGMDCCQAASGRLSAAPAGVPQPDLAPGPAPAADPAAAPAVRPLRAPAAAVPLAAPAVVQGVGLYTLLAVFLI